MSSQQLRHTQLLQCTQQRLSVEQSLHRLACQEIVLIKEKRDHEQQYGDKDVQETLHDLERKAYYTSTENEQLKLDGLRQRKQNSILRLKLASAREDVELVQRNMALLNQHTHRLGKEAGTAKLALARAEQHITQLYADKAALQADDAKHQREALQANADLAQLREELKLSSDRLNTATGHAADLLQQLKSVQAENASLTNQLALSQGKDAEAAAAHAVLQTSLKSMRADMESLRQQLVAEEARRVAADTAAATATAAAETARHALEVKEEQLTAWKDLEQASKAAATQQMQLSQAQLDGMHQRATATQASLLEQVASLQQQLDKERAERCAPEDVKAASTSRATKQHAALEQQVTTLQKQVAQAKVELAEAKADAAQASKRAAALQHDLEHLQEQTVDTVDELVENLTQGHEIEDDHELQQARRQQQQQQPQSKLPAGGTRGSRATKSSTKKPRPAGAENAAVAGTPAVQTAVFGPLAAQLSGIQEVTETGDDEVDAHAATHKGNQQEQEQPAAQRLQADATGPGPRSAKGRTAKSKAAQGIRAAAAVEESPAEHPPAGDTDALGAPATGLGARRVSPRTRGSQPAAAQQSQADTQNSSILTENHRMPTSGKMQQQAAVGKGKAAVSDAAVSRREAPPPLGFVPQSTVTPAAALQQPGVIKAAAERLSAASMLKKINLGATSHAGKPGARKRKLGPVTGNGSMDVLPSTLLMSTGFKPPKVRHVG